MISTNRKPYCIIIAFFCSVVTLSCGQQAQQRKKGQPLDHLPGNIEILTHFGERADFSPDNDAVAFIAKGNGDAMVIDLKTRKIKCLTCSTPGAAFLRVMHLSTGDYMLFGPGNIADIDADRKDDEVWFLSKKAGSKPVKTGLRIKGGMAISKTSLKIAYTVIANPGEIIAADLDLSAAVPKITNEKTVYTDKDKSYTVEAQDFYDNDSRLTFSRYDPSHLSSVMGLKLKTGEATDFSKSPGVYNEAEGILPDKAGYAAIESDRQCEWLGGKRGLTNLDIWKLKLDGTGKNWERLTYFNDYEGGKASNPVISTDGRYMAFQIANTAAAAGTGFGILLYRFNK